MKKTILLTGATGSVGFEALRELLRRRKHYRIRVLSLDAPQERQIIEPYANDIEVVWGDIRYPTDVIRAIAGVDTVLHVAAVIPPLADHKPELAYEVNVGGTRNLIAAMQAQEQPPRLIFTSSISVYGDRLTDPFIRVDDPLVPSVGDEYACTKIEAEKMVQASGLSWTIFRLCGILNPKMMKVQPLMFHMPLDTALEWCHNSDAGLALVNAIENDAVLGKIFNLGGGETCQISARDFFGLTLPMFGIKPGALPEYAFATQNFHSGYYADGSKLNKLLNFQRKSLYDYLVEAREKISPLQKTLVKLMPGKLIQNYFLNMSEPLQAILEDNQELIARYYGSRDVFESLLTPKLKKKYVKVRK